MKIKYIFEKRKKKLQKGKWWGRDRGGDYVERNPSSISWFITQMPTMARVRLGQSQELGAAASRSLTWMQQLRHLENPPLLFLRHISRELDP